jgi:hypothetical protein
MQNVVRPTRSNRGSNELRVGHREVGGAKDLAAVPRNDVFCRFAVWHLKMRGKHVADNFREYEPRYKPCRDSPTHVYRKELDSCFSRSLPLHLLAVWLIVTFGFVVTSMRKAFEVYVVFCAWQFARTAFPVTGSERASERSPGVILSVIVNTRWYPKCSGLNSRFYCDVLRWLRENVRRRRPKLWREQTRLLQLDNAPSHISVLTQQFLAKY